MDVKRSIAAVGTLLLALAAAETAWAQNEHYLPPPPDPSHGHASYWTWRATPPITQPTSNLDVTYSIAAGFTSDQIDRINAAAATWTGSQAYVNLIPVGGGADISILPISVPPGFPPPSSHDLTYSAGHPVVADWHQITGATIYMDQLFPATTTWYAGADPNAIGGADLDFQSYILHELGRALGLGVATAGDGADSVMIPGLAPGTTRRIISRDDSHALQFLYGNPEPATFVLFGLGLAGVAVTRRKLRARKQ